jgi:hypothetical protein
MNPFRECRPGKVKVDPFMVDTLIPTETINNRQHLVALLRKNNNVDISDTGIISLLHLPRTTWPMDRHVRLPLIYG